MIKFDLRKKLDAADGPMNLEVACELSAGSLVALYGPSGVGKTSLLRMLAGLLSVDQGRIEVKGKEWLNSDQGIYLKPQDRKIGLVFQDYALFPNMTVRQNLEFAKRHQGDQALIEELISIAELDGLQNRLPGTLSGGQQQRVALARALVRQPELLLLDEPLSALDKNMRSKLQNYLKEVHQRYGLTTILVSHDIGEIVKLADQVFVLHQGKIIKSGDPFSVFSPRLTPDPFQFTGEVVRIETRSDHALVSILAGTHLAQVKIPEQALGDIQVGHEVLLRAPEFNPIIERLL